MEDLIDLSIYSTVENQTCLEDFSGNLVDLRGSKLFTIISGTFEGIWCSKLRIYTVYFWAFLYCSRLYSPSGGHYLGDEGYLLLLL